MSETESTQGQWAVWANKVRFAEHDRILATVRLAYCIKNHAEDCACAFRVVS